MELIETQKLTLDEINQFFSLPESNDFSSYFDKYDNGVFIIDKNYKYTAFIRNSNLFYIVRVGGDTWRDYISIKHKKYSRTLQLYRNDEYITDEKLILKYFDNKEAKFECYEIVAPNVCLYKLTKEEEDVFDAMENQIDEPKYNVYDDIPYLGLRSDEQETGHWNID